MFRRRFARRRPIRSFRRPRQSFVMAPRVNPSLMQRIGSGVMRYGPTVLRTGMGLINTVRNLKGLINAEFKTYTYARSSMDGTSLTPTINVQYMGLSGHVSTGIAQGTGDYQRTGNSIKLKSLNLKLMLRQAYDASQATPSQVRIVVFWAPALNGTTITNIPVSDVLALKASDTTTNVNPILRNRNILKKPLYNVLLDKIISINSQMSPNQCVSKVFEYYKKLDLHQDFITTGYDDASRMNNLVMLYVADFTGLGGNTFLDATATIRYLDN